MHTERFSFHRFGQNMSHEKVAGSRFLFFYWGNKNLFSAASWFVTPLQRRSYFTEFVENKGDGLAKKSQEFAIKSNPLISIHFCPRLNSFNSINSLDQPLGLRLVITLLTLEFTSYNLIEYTLFCLAHLCMEKN